MRTPTARQTQNALLLEQGGILGDLHQHIFNFVNYRHVLFFNFITSTISMFIGMFNSETKDLNGPKRTTT